MCHLIELPLAGWLRSFIADYGVPLMVIVWTALSYTLPSKVPSGVPRRLFSPLAWESSSLQHWTVAKVAMHPYLWIMSHFGTHLYPHVSASKMILKWCIAWGQKLDK